MYLGNLKRVNQFARQGEECPAERTKPQMVSSRMEPIMESFLKAFWHLFDIETPISLAYEQIALPKSRTSFWPEHVIC